jgi:hypothetical protein
MPNTESEQNQITLTRRGFLILASGAIASGIAAVTGLELMNSGEPDPRRQRASQIFQEQASLAPSLRAKGLITDRLLSSQVVPLASDPEAQKFYQLERERNQLYAELETSGKSREDSNKLMLTVSGFTGLWISLLTLRRSRNTDSLNNS